MKVRRVRSNATYPPTGGIMESPGLTARFILGGGQVFAINLTKQAIVHDEIVYARALGSVAGGIKAGRSIPVVFIMRDTHMGYCLVNSVFASHLSILSVKLCTYEGFVEKTREGARRNEGESQLEVLHAEGNDPCSTPS